MQKELNDGSIPLQIINQLNEHTEGGFVLFYFNAKDGSPEQIMTFDSPAHSLALQKHIGDWSMAVSDMSVEQEKFFIQQACKAQSGGEEESPESS